MIQILTFLLVVQWAMCAPLPLVLTRVHTANPVTVMNTVTTGTTTLLLPPVEIFISNGVTYTFTHTESPAGTPVTSTVEHKDAPTTAAATTQPAATTEATNQPANTQAANTQASPTTPKTQNSPTTDAPTQEPTQTPTQEPTQETTQKNTPTSPKETETTTSSTSTETSGGILDGSIPVPSAIVYSPYADDGSCKLQSTIKSDLQYINKKGIKAIRVYGTDCHTLDTVLPTCSDLGMKVNQGFWISPAGTDSIDDSVSDFLDYAKDNGFGVIDFITVGNEAVNSKHCTVSQLMDKISLVKSQLKNAGYSGKVTTSEPPISFISHPELCTKSGIDFVGINPHSYFDTNMYASDAGDYVTDQKSQTQDACNNMDVLITETGYPSQGIKNGNNVPSPDNQEAAIKSIIQKTGGDVTILTTFDDFWKPPGPYGVEQYFGVIKLFQ